MKVNLTIGGQSINGFMNLDQVAQPNQSDRQLADLAKLDDIIDHNEVDEELLALDVINFFPLQMVPQVVNHWCCKIAHGGLITISSLDLQEAARTISLGTISDTLQINRLLYGNVTNTWTIRKSFVGLQDVITIVTQTGQFDVGQIKFSPDGLFFVVTFRRK